MKKHLKILLLTGIFCLLTALLALSASAAYETGGKSYDTLKEAVTAVKSGGTIVATGNTTESSAVALDADKAYTIDAGRYTITFGASIGLNITKGTVTISGGTFDGMLFSDWLAEHKDAVCEGWDGERFPLLINRPCMMLIAQVMKIFFQTSLADSLDDLFVSFAYEIDSQ